MDENEAQITVESQTMTDIDNRDPKEIHAEGARVEFADVIAEPDGLHSLDFMWKGNGKDTFQSEIDYTQGGLSPVQLHHSGIKTNGSRTMEENVIAEESVIMMERQTMADLDNRDPKEIHGEGVRVEFADVIAEPDGLHSLDFLWKSGYTSYPESINLEKEEMELIKR
ncbi:Caveolin-1 [Larimichthys crocea]|uniref:Caveolin n=1 Tax=Larimichthys crocea TaxID=215358 RepID=A0A6G0J3X4_LARCR|nr:Caveolin-1 [Larimichthys crocea]